MRILLVTGRLAYPVVKAVAGGADVLALDVGVAAFITPAGLERALAPLRGDYDLVLVTGLAASDFSGVERRLGVKVRLGPKQAYDIPLALAAAGTVEFSGTVPADMLLADVKRENARKELAEIEAGAAGAFMLKGVKIGGDATMKVVAEVADATVLSDAVLVERIEGYGAADVVDLGVPLESSSDAVRHAVRVARSATRKPVSVDTLVPEYIRAGIDEGASLVLSLNGTNLDAVGPLVAEKGLAAVVIPDDGDEGSLAGNVARARALGIKNILADPVLSPVGHGFVEAVERYRAFRRRDPATPLFFGAGNVTELMDADSAGVNALLAGIGMELGVAALFTTEASRKTLGSAAELKAACEMMALARRRSGPPKDLGLDLLVIKEKRMRVDLAEPGPGAVEAKRHGLTLDPMGSFNVYVRDGRIFVRNGAVTVSGDEPMAIIETLDDLGLVSRLDHAGYLGKELEKARLAILFRRSYVQDEPF